ncbi:MAG: MMPL family transporter [Planctomycetota bacterium]
MRRLSLYLWPALFVLACIGWTRLELDPSVENTLGQGFPAVDAMVQINERFRIGGTAHVLVSSRDDATPLPIEAIDQLRDAIRDSQGLEELGVEAQAVAELQARDWVIQQVPRGRAWLSEEAVVELRARLEPESIRARLQRHKQRLATPQPAEVTRQMLRDPLGLRELVPRDFAERLGADTPSAPGIDETEWSAPTNPLAGRFSASGTAWSLTLAVPFAPSDHARSVELSEALNGVLAPLGRDYPTLRFEAVGGHMMAAEAAGRVRDDIKGSVLFASVGLVGVFLIVWRRLTPIVLLLTTTLVAMFTAFGLFGLTGMRLSPLAALSGGMLAGLGVDYGIHLLTEVRRAAPDGTTPVQRAWSAARTLARPIATACITTTCGFLALLATEPTALKQLAVLGGLALACAAIASLTLLPTLTGLCKTVTPRTSATPHRLLVWALAHSTWLRVAGIAFVLVMILSAVLIRGDDSALTLYNLHPQPNPTLEAQQRMERSFGQRQGSVLVLIEAEDAGQLYERLDRLHGLDTPFEKASALSLLPEAGADVRNSALLADIDPVEVKRLLLEAAGQAGFRPAVFEPAGDFLAGFLATPSPGLEALARSGAGGLFFPSPFDADAPATVALLVPTRSWARESDRREDLDGLREALSGLDGFQATGLDLISEQMRKQLRRDLLRAFAWSVIPIGLVLLVSLRRVGRVVVTVLPPAMGLLAALLVQRLGSGQWNVVTLAAVPLLLGIGVDASLLLGDAVARGCVVTIRSRLTGIHLTFVTTFIGFGSLMWTSIPAVRELGWMVTAGLVAVLVTTWLLGLSVGRRNAGSLLVEGQDR